MITVSNKEETVIINVSMTIGWNINFKAQRSGEMDAILLRNQIQKDLSDKIEKIRRDAYNLGWKEAKSKKVAKRTWFNGNINSDMV